MSRNWREKGKDQVEGREIMTSALDLFIKFEMISIASMPTITSLTNSFFPVIKEIKTEVRYHFSLRNFIKSFQNCKPSVGKGGYINYNGRRNKPLQT